MIQVLLKKKKKKEERIIKEECIMKEYERKNEWKILERKKKKVDEDNERNVNGSNVRVKNEKLKKEN